jgi:hypothetical protein
MAKRKFLIALLLAVIVLVPYFVFNLFPPEVPYGWENNRFLSGTFDLSRQQLPPVYQEVRRWLDTQVQPGDIFRLFWLPIDPAVVSNLEFLYPDAPTFFPRFDERNYTQTIFDYMQNAPNLGWSTGLGKLLANANVKYVIVNLSANDGGGIWKQQGPISLSPWGPSYDLKYYFTGDPKAYEKFLDNQHHLRVVTQDQRFVVYENLDFVPYFSAYRSSYLVLPASALDQRIPTFSGYNYSNNLLKNGGFENGLQNWGLQGNWGVSSSSHSGNYAIEGNATGEEWIQARQDVNLPENTSYYVSGWMKAQNVDQAHLKLTFYNSTGFPILNTNPQSGKDGSWEWLHVVQAGVSPKGTSWVAILLVGGWSLDRMNPGLTWFDDISFFEGYYPNPSPIHSWAYPILMASSVGGLLSDVPTFSDRSLVVSAEVISPSSVNDESVKQIGDRSSGLILMGDARSNSTLTTWIDRFPRLIFVYEAESVLQPESGRWEHLEAPSIGIPKGIMVDGAGQATQNFFVPRNSNYTIAVHILDNGKTTLKLDNNSLGWAPFLDNSGQSNSWYQSNTVALRYGQHQMTIITNSSSTVVDKIVLLSSIATTFRLGDLAPGDSPRVNFTKISSTHYSLQLSSQGPVFILFGETYDSSWNGYDGNLRLNHDPVPFHLYWSNLYELASFGRTTVEVYFEHQESRNAIITIWGSGWILSLGYISFGYRRRIVEFARKMKSGLGKWV